MNVSRCRSRIVTCILRLRSAYYSPRESNLGDAIYAHGLEGDNDDEPEEAVPQEFASNDNEQQPEDTDELAAVKRDLIESSGYPV
jgi:hypothetical protein